MEVHRGEGHGCSVIRYDGKVTIIFACAIAINFIQNRISSRVPTLSLTFATDMNSSHKVFVPPGFTNVFSPL